MRTIPDPAERGIPPLGSPIRPAAPAPAPVPVAPGIVQGPDGRLETQIPVPSQPRWTP